MKKMKNRAAAFLAASVMAVGGMVAGCGSSPSGMVQVQNVDQQVIRVSSRETVKAVPDMAQIVYSVYSQASDAQTCQTQNGTDLSRVLELLKEQGVAEPSIQTSSYGLNPIYDWDTDKSIAGYEMTTRVQVSDIPMDQVGTLLSESVNAGINSIESVTYLCSTYDKAYEEALQKAIASAQSKAKVMAESGGCALGKIVSIEEHGNSQTARYNAMETAGAKLESGAGVADMEVMPGQIEITADIVAEFSIK